MLGPEHPDTLTSAGNLAGTLHAQGDLAGARGINESVFEALQRVLGPEHPHTLVSACNLAITLKGLTDLAACADRCLSVLTALSASPRIDSSALGTAAGMPLLLEPSLDWPPSAVSALHKVLEQLSQNARAQWLALPVDLAQPMYEALLALHERWGVFVSYRLPEHQQVDALLAILAPLHGSQSQAQLGQQALCLAASGSASPAAAAYAAALPRAQALGDAVHSALQERAQFSQQALNLQHLLSRTRQGEGELAQQVAQDLDLVPRLQAEWEKKRRQAEAARLKLEEVAAESRTANAAVQQALQALVSADPVLAGLAIPVIPTQASIQATLAEDELWLVPLPGKALAPDPEKLDQQAQNAPSFLLALRKNQPGQIITTLPNAHLGLFSDVCRDSARLLNRGLLRDSEPGLEPLVQAQQLDPFDLLRDVTQSGFWDRLGPMLGGVRRIHLVSAAGSHDLMLEPGQPAAHAGIVLHRYCGLPAYWRRAQAPQRQAAPALRYCWVHDEAWDSGCPILFTPLDSLYLRHHRLGQPQTAQDLHDNGPAADVLLVSSHGLQGGDGSTRGGRLLVQGQHLSPAALSRRRDDTHRGNAQSLRGLIALSCFGGVVGSTGHGDALGTIAALQAAGLQWAIACLAPVPDFYTPLFSAILLHELQTHDDAALALESAKRMLTQGPWDARLQQQVIAPLRQAYRERMLQLLREGLDPGADEEQVERSQKILHGVHGWSLPGAYRHALRGATVQALVSTSEHAQRSFVDACLDVLLRPPQDRSEQDQDEDGHVARQLQHLADVTVFFGRS